MDESDNGEWWALLTYKIGQKITILSQEAHFLVNTLIWKGRCWISLRMDRRLLVVSLSTHVLNNRLASQSVIGSRGNYHDIVVTYETVV